MTMKAKGTTVTFGSAMSGNVIAVGPPGMSIEKIKTTHMGSTGVAHPYVFADFAENGTLRLIIEFEAQVTIPIGTSQVIGIHFPNSYYWTFTGGVENFEPSDLNVEDAGRWECAVDIAVLGDVARATSS